MKFIIKCFIFTLLLISLMQMKFGEVTLETKTYQALAQSQLTVFIGDVARKAVHLGRQLKHEVEQKFQDGNDKN